MTEKLGPDQAMVLAAGLGLRMRPLTLTRPKPLLSVAGRTLLDHALDRLEQAGVRRATVNSHYKSEMIAEHLAGRVQPAIRLALEAELLETGGGVRRSLDHFGIDPFYVVNADILWLDGPKASALRRLAAAWDGERMDALLLLTARQGAMGYDGPGDYFLAEGALSRRAAGQTAPWVFAGVQIVHPRLYADTPEGAFSNNLVWDRAQAAGRLCGLAHDGPWFHVGTPEALAATERWFEENRGG
jgi:MurNAc alpha-1-phosphate uridylyltransferase